LFHALPSSRADRQLRKISKIISKTCDGNLSHKQLDRPQVPGGSSDQTLIDQFGKWNEFTHASFVIPHSPVTLRANNAATNPVLHAWQATIDVTDKPRTAAYWFALDVDKLIR